MITSEFKLTVEQNLDMQVYSWLPEKDVSLKGIVQIAHGMAEHAKRYEEFASYLTKNGYAVYANDHRGHGKTAGSVENLGFFSKENGWKKVVNDLKLLNQHIKKKHNTIPLFVLGHSMGSFLTRQYLMDPKIKLHGALLSGTANHPGVLGKVGLFLTKLLLLFNNPKSPSSLMDSLSFKAYNKAFKPNRTSFDWLSKDEKKVDEYVSDSYCGTIFSVQFYNDLLKGLLYISDIKNIKKTNQNIPILVFSGANDPVGENGKGVQKFYTKLKTAGIKDITLKLFEDGRHEMLNETNRKEVYAYILQWLNKRK